MSDPFPPCPGPPDYRVAWEALHERYPWVRALAGCPQDPVHHAESDVGTHLRMVLEELAALPGWRALPEEDRRVVFTAALLHDVAKPECTRPDPNGRLGARGHSRRGAVLARRILWRLGVPFALRERVTALVRFHMVPFYLIERPDGPRLAAELSETARADHLALLAEADARGRRCHDQARLLDNVALFAEFCREHGCLTGPRPFPSDHTRFLYFRDAGRHPDIPAHDDCRATVVLLSGLPGAGKDHWLTTHLPDWPVVGLDALRAELEVAPTDAQGPVLNRARDLARVYLREGRSFAWNATNLSKQVRGECIRLFAAYRARVRIVYVEADEPRLLAQNRRRPVPVPEAVIERLLDRWEVPDRTEAHEVEWVVPP